MRVEWVGIGLERLEDWMGSGLRMAMQCPTWSVLLPKWWVKTWSATLLLRVHHSDKQIQTEDAPILGY